MKKSNFWCILMLVVVAGLSVCLASCGDDEDEVTSKSGNTVKPGGGGSTSSGIPIGWYESGDLERFTSSNMNTMISAGDKEGIKREDWWSGYDFITAIHVTSSSTFETVVGGASLTRPDDYYASHSFSGGYTLYYSYKYPLNDYYYTLSNGQGTVTFADTGNSAGKLAYSNGIITWNNRPYNKLNYSPKEW